MRIEIKPALKISGGLTTVDAEMIVKNPTITGTNNLQSQIPTSVKSTFEELLNAIYLNWKHDLKFCTFNVIEQVLEEEIRSGRASTVSMPEMSSLVKTKDVVDTIYCQ